MDKYIQQLIEDLEKAAKNPPSPDYIEPPPHLEEEPVIAELALVPFKTIEELTGIGQEAFPELNDLTARHWRAVLDAIFKVFDSLKIKLIDDPKGMPKEWLYETITANWQYEVQYLPLTGMDLELCSSDPMTCPYGMYCDCGHEWPDDEENFEIEREIPGEYEALLPKIAGVIDAGLVCIFFDDNMELIRITQAEYYNPEDPDPLLKIINRDDNDIFSSTNKFTIEPLLNYERANMMEDFASGLRVEPLRSRLLNALVSEKFEEKFNAIVLQSDEKQNWLNFKQNWLEEYVRAVIWQDIRIDCFLSEKVNGFFNDDGTPIDTNTVPTPNLCMLCKSFYTGDSEENILCILNRNDQRNEPDFKCEAFESI
ncbi:MAG: hypothetical protein K9H26_07800 [Prolixibacteraceae bacterium]|nr:hypothetical protein [Prolixibacteraceae bacterium]